MTAVERAFPALLQDFFHRRLVAQRGASAHTIASYRDTFTLFLGYAAERTGRTPSALTLSDLDAPMVLGFLDHIETERGNSARTRNLRLAAIRSFMRYASLREPTLLPVAQRVLTIPVKRFDRPVLSYLSRNEIAAIIDAPDRSTWSGQRDAVLFAVLYNTGARVSEITRLHFADVLLERACSRCFCTARDARSGSSRSGRAPRRSSGGGSPESIDAPTPLSFPIAQANPCRAPVSSTNCASPVERPRSVTPHSQRDGSHPTRCATRPRCICSSPGFDITVIALWLGHEDTATTHQCVEADLAMKEAALRCVKDPAPQPLRFTANDRLLDFLEAL